MALFIKDPDVDRMATLLAESRKTTKTEVVRQALRLELQREKKDEDDFVERVMAFARRVKAKGDPSKIQPVDKAFIDSLYED
jgi:antitoxin VapB